MSFFTSDEGVSESLSFVLVALILMITMAMVLMIGYPIYQGSVEDTHMQNMAEGFYLLGDNINKVALYESPVQSSELKLYGGTLGVHDDGDVEISYSTDGVTWSTPISTNEQIMEYGLNTRRVAYILGGVFKMDGSSSMVLKDPIVYQYPNDPNGAIPPDTVVIPTIDYDQASITSFSGVDLARVEVKSPYYSKWEGTNVYGGADVCPGVQYIKITIKSDYRDAIARYFENNLKFTQVSNAGGVITIQRDYTAHPVTLYIPHGKLLVTIN